MGIDLHIGLSPAMSKAHWGSEDHAPAAVIDDVREMHLMAARSEVVGFQVRLAAREDFILVLDRANWLHATGFIPRVRLEITFPGLPVNSLELFSVGYVEGDNRRYWMESLERTGYAEALAYRPQAAYVRLSIPPGLPPGMYVGTVKAFTQSSFEDETQVWEGNVRSLRRLKDDVREVAAGLECGIGLDYGDIKEHDVIECSKR